MNFFLQTTGQQICVCHILSEVLSMSVDNSVKMCPVCDRSAAPPSLSTQQLVLILNVRMKMLEEESPVVIVALTQNSTKVVPVSAGLSEGCPAGCYATINPQMSCSLQGNMTEQSLLVITELLALLAC